MSPPPAPADGPSARGRILDAAESRLLKLGPKGLVLEAVAREARVSKGGLLYHFASKEALVEGLCERMLDDFERVQDRLAEGDDAADGRWTRAYLASTVDEHGEPADASAQLMAGLLAGLGGDTARLGAVRERFAAWQHRLERDGIDPVEATIVRLAADGLWLAALLGLPRLDPPLRARVLEALRARTRGSGEA